jgi:putative ubiquitin-RnfH superfamily antitoxin RatB of RatAB toxin-antitoxin module
VSKCCHLVCDTPAGVLECELTLADEADIAAAIEAARQHFGADAAPWQTAVAGIFGSVRERSYVPADGDRIELYRELLIDPRRARRDRAARGTKRPG